MRSLILAQWYATLRRTHVRMEAMSGLLKLELERYALPKPGEQRPRATAQLAALAAALRNEAKAHDEARTSTHNHYDPYYEARNEHFSRNNGRNGFEAISKLFRA
eukprot:1960115-Prymnesium_polylepis.1